jgi:uncharacterized protein (DUF1330 family)
MRTIEIDLLRFKDRADYGDRTDVTPCSGRDAYFLRYAPVSSALVKAEGAKVVWVGNVMARVVGPPDEHWDQALLVEYTSFASFQRLFANPAYQAVVFHRSAALEDSRFLASATIPFEI